MHFRRDQLIAAPQSLVFDYHEREGALERLSPPWERMRILSHMGGIKNGGEMRARLLMLGPFGPIWHAAHHGYEPPQEFRDTQKSGPFAEWQHVHRFEQRDAEHTLLSDDITYRLPLGALGRFFGGAMVGRRLERMFRYRHVVTVADTERHHWARAHGAWRIAITGSTGLIGTALSRFLSLGGHTVLLLVRTRDVQGIYWNPERGEIDAAGLEGVDAVVHLAGENVAAARWSSQPESVRGVQERSDEGRAPGIEAVAAGSDGNGFDA